MSKQSGIGWTTLDIDDATGTVAHLKSGTTNFQFATPRGVQDVTGVSSSAMERILLLADFSITVNGPFDPAAGATHAVFSTVPSSSVARTTTLVVASQSLAAEVLYTDYPLTRANSGELTFAVPGVLADGTVPTWGTV